MRRNQEFQFVWMTVRRVTIAVPAGLSTVPLVYGIGHAKCLHADVVSSSPGDSAEAFHSGRAEIALLPVGELLQLKDADIVTSYCLGSGGSMRTSMVAGRVPAEKADRVFFTRDSLTESLYLKILSVKKWGRGLKTEPVGKLPAADSLAEGDVCIFTGDDAAEQSSSYAHAGDLSQMWNLASRQPFVYAVWVARKSVENAVLDALQESLTFGLEHVWEAVSESADVDGLQAYDYITSNIDYIFDNQKNKALKKFWETGLKTTLRINPG